MGRALMAGPRLLMLDEPSGGLAPMLVRELMDKVHQVSVSFGTTVLLVEQNIRDRPQSLLQDDRLRRAYLG